jgi:hypothetical protein
MQSRATTKMERGKNNPVLCKIKGIPDVKIVLINCLFSRRYKWLKYGEIFA